MHDEDDDEDGGEHGGGHFDEDGGEDGEDEEDEDEDGEDGEEEEEFEGADDLPDMGLQDVVFVRASPLPCLAALLCMHPWAAGSTARPCCLHASPGCGLICLALLLVCFAGCTFSRSLDR